MQKNITNMMCKTLRLRCQTFRNAKNGASIANFVWRRRRLHIHEGTTWPFDCQGRLSCAHCRGQAQKNRQWVIAGVAVLPVFFALSG